MKREVTRGCWGQIGTIGGGNNGRSASADGENGDQGSKLLLLHYYAGAHLASLLLLLHGQSD